MLSQSFSRSPLSVADCAASLGVTMRWMPSRTPASAMGRRASSMEPPGATLDGRRSPGQVGLEALDERWLRDQDHTGRNEAMKTRLAGLAWIVGALIALGATTAPVWAHHSFAAEFDRSKPITVKGVITKLEWMNPHIWFYVDVKD